MIEKQPTPEAPPPLQKSRPPNPLEGASFLSMLTFAWPRPIINRGLQGPIDEIDIPDVLPQESSTRNRLMVEEAWEQECEDAIRDRRLPNLHRAILRLYIRKLWFVQPLIGLTSAARIGQALALGRLIQYMEDGTSTSDGFWRATVLVLCSLVPMITHHQTYFRAWRMGMQLRIGAVAAMYAKSLRLSSIGGNKGTTSGELLNLASNDVERFLYASLFVSYLFWAPLEALVVLVVGIQTLGPAFAAGYVVLFTFVPAQFVLGKKFARLRSQVAAITDKRVSLLSQAVSGVRVMKMNGWEFQFKDRIDRIRQQEVGKIKSASRFRALNEAIYFGTNISVASVIFIVQVLSGNRLTPRCVFTTFTLINVVQFTMTKFFAFAVMSVSECFVSIHRLQQFLQLPEVDENLTSESFTKQESRSSPAITIEKVTSYWEMDLKKRVLSLDQEDRPPRLFKLLSSKHSKETTSKTSGSAVSQKSVALADISMELGSGHLYCLIGPVGSGKSALLHTLSGELLPATGRIHRNITSIAYASQDPWIMDGTVRENVIMGLPFDVRKFHEVIHACGLVPDIQSFSNGEETIVGDRGVQCSGGQRARIGLARALYRDAQLILLDDPLSAVDSKVSRLIFNSAIKDLCVRRGKCVVLATHQHQLIGNETCVLMNRGHAQCVGSYEDCITASGGLLKPVVQVEEEEQQEEEQEKEISSKDGKEANVQEDTSSELFVENPSAPKTSKSTSTAAHKETSRKGSLERKTWRAYIEAMGGIPVVVGLLLLFAVTQATLLVAIARIGQWSQMDGSKQNSPIILLTIAVFVVVVNILAVLRAILAFRITIGASQRLHDQMTLSVLRARIEFFDTNPAGRILNRFSADVGSNDDQLPAGLSDTASIGFIVLGGIITAATVLPFLLIVFPVLVWYFLRVRGMFVTTSRELKRYEGMARSPIYAMMSESINGVGSIRANGSIEYFLEKFQSVQNAHSRAFFTFIATTRWLNFRLESITVTFLACASLLAVTVHELDWFDISPSILGLSLTLLLQLSGLLQWAVRQSSEVINMMVSVERVSSYATLEAEGDLSTPIDTELKDWPAKGKVEAEHLSVRYRQDLPKVLKGATFSIEGGERVGVVGRTGSGKSTVIQSLFRLLEPESGRIQIDGIDLSTIGLHTLRTRMSVIPQSPVLFSGSSIRENLDPFGKYDEKLMKRALSDVQMLSAIEDLPDGLNTLVAENGSNFSVGQRQLLCVARSILQKNRILILDEPTANVDSRTDILLQNAVANSFPGSTVIAVAHRLDTIIDFDKIMVIGGGEVLEFGSPQELISKDGHFAAMVSDTGMSMSRQLRRRAVKVSR